MDKLSLRRSVKGECMMPRLFKLHRIPLLPEQLCLADKGYQGISKLHPLQLYPDQEAPRS